MSKEPSSIRKDIVLLILGATISSASVFITDYINNGRHAKEKKVAAMIELSDQLSKDVGKRLYFTLQVSRDIYDGDSVLLKEDMKEYREAIEQCNIKIYNYQSLLSYYFGEEQKKKFVSVYNEIQACGKTLTRDHTITKEKAGEINDQLMKLTVSFTNYIGGLYDQANK